MRQLLEGALKNAGDVCRAILIGDEHAPAAEFAMQSQ